MLYLLLTVIQLLATLVSPASKLFHIYKLVYLYCRVITNFKKNLNIKRVTKAL